MVRQWYRLLMTRTLTCTECGTLFEESRKAKLDSWKRSDRAYCRDACRDAWVSRDRSERMARTNRAHASERMRRKNPMHSAETRVKMSETLKRIGHKPRERGGNGSATPEPQKRLAEFLGWRTEFTIIPSDGARPYHYKADIVHPTMKVCVEVDGGSHFSLDRQSCDRRRDERLRSLGWLVFRFSNQEAMERTAECAQTVLSTTLKWTPRIRT